MAGRLPNVSAEKPNNSSMSYDRDGSSGLRFLLLLKRLLSLQKRQKTGRGESDEASGKSEPRCGSSEFPSRDRNHDLPDRNSFPRIGTKIPFIGIPFPGFGAWIRPIGVPFPRIGTMICLIGTPFPGIGASIRLIGTPFPAVGTADIEQSGHVRATGVYDQ